MMAVSLRDEHRALQQLGMGDEHVDDPVGRGDVVGA